MIVTYKLEHVENKVFLKLENYSFGTIKIETLGPYASKEEARLVLRDDFNVCHICCHKVDYSGRCQQCGNNASDLLFEEN